MDARLLSEARHRGYALVGRLVMRGLDGDTREVVGALPVLDGAVSGEDPERWAVDHQRVYGFQVFPYASVFLGEEGLLGGGEGGSVEGDHLGAELLQLANLCAAERDARVDGKEPVAAQMLGVQRDYLAKHLLPWLPAVLVAVESEGTAFDRALVGLVAEMVGDQAVTMGISDADLPEAVAPLDVDGLLEHRKTGVKRIAEVLLRPAVTGWFLSAAGIGRLAAAAGVPEGFGPRAKKLESVVFAAVDRDALPALVEALKAELGRWRQRYTELAEQGLPVESWLARLSKTEELADRLETAAMELRQTEGG